MADAEYFEEGAQSPDASARPTTSTPPMSGSIVRNQIHKHMLKGSQKKSDLALLHFFVFLFWVAVWTGVMAIINFVLDYYMKTGFSGLLCLIVGFMLSIMWITRCRKCSK